MPASVVKASAAGFLLLLHLSPVKNTYRENCTLFSVTATSQYMMPIVQTRNCVYKDIKNILNPVDFLSGETCRKGLTEQVSQ